MPTLKMDGLNFCVLLLGLRNDFYLHQNKFSSCKSADDCKQFFLCLLWLFRKDLQKSLPQTENLKNGLHGVCFE